MNDASSIESLLEQLATHGEVDVDIVNRLLNLVDGRRFATEYGIPIDHGVALDDAPPPWRIQFIDADLATDGPGEPWADPVWVRDVGPWRLLSR